MIFACGSCLKIGKTYDSVYEELDRRTSVKLMNPSIYNGRSVYIDVLGVFTIL